MSERDGFVYVAHSTHPVAAVGVGEIVAELMDNNVLRPDVLFVFVTSPFAGALEDIAPALRRLVSPTTLIGCAAEQVIGPDGWLVGEACIAVLAVNTGEVETLRYAPGDVIESPVSGTAVLLADPHTTAISLLSDLCGGYVTGAEGPGGSRMVLDDTIHTDGAVGVVFPDGTLRTTTDTYTLNARMWRNGRAALAFSEVDLYLWSKKLTKKDTEEGLEEVPPILTGFLSARTFPKTIAVFDWPS